MKRIPYAFLLFLLLQGVLYGDASEKRTRVLNVASGLVGVRESTGRNDGEVVEKILRSVGAEKGQPWCAAFNYYVYEQADLNTLVPRSAWSPDWVRGAEWKKGTGKTPQGGDSFGIYFPKLGRVAHTGLVEKWGSNGSCATIEGNTNGGGSRDGDGVYRRIRLKGQIYAVKSWIKD